MPSRLDIQLGVEDGAWPAEDELNAYAERVLEHAAAHLAEKQAQPFPTHPVEVSLVFTNDGKYRA
jgi:probable rRNA maturation factor